LRGQAARDLVTLLSLPSVVASSAGLVVLDLSGGTRWSAGMGRPGV
jgi:hypothetical protein